MQNNQDKIYIGIIPFGESSIKYLPDFLLSLKKQTFQNFVLLAQDNCEEEKNVSAEFLRSNFPEARISWSGKNLGLGRAYNVMIRQSIQAGAKYFLMLNIDMVLVDDFLEKIYQEINNTKAAVVVPKILFWDFVNKLQTDIIDSCGIQITQSQTFYDIGQGEKDSEKFNQVKEVFGFSGAAALFDLSVLREVAFLNEKAEEEYFDELMFMYKEDCDLSYRLRLAGKKIIFSPSARVFHDRTAFGKGQSNLQVAFNRKNKNQQVKRWSFLNQWIIFEKYRYLRLPWPVRFSTAWYMFKSLVFASVFESYLWAEFKNLKKLRSQINARRKALQVKIDIKDIFTDKVSGK